MSKPSETASDPAQADSPRRAPARATGVEPDAETEERLRQRLRIRELEMRLAAVERASQQVVGEAWARNAALERELRQARAADGAAAAGAEEPVEAQPGEALPGSPYFGGIELGVVLPAGVAPPGDLPLGLVRPIWFARTAEGGWRRCGGDGAAGDPLEVLPAGNYWCPDLRQAMPTPHQLATLTAAVQLTEIDLAVGSWSLDMPPEVTVNCARNQMVMRDTQVGDFLAGCGLRPLTGKVLRIPDGVAAETRKVDLAALIGHAVRFGADGQTFAAGPEAPAPVAMRAQPAPRPLARSRGRLRILVLAQKLAVGGVERNTIEVTRQLRDGHECLYLTLEQIGAERGSLCHQATEACDQVLDLAEIGHHGIFRALLAHMNALYRPDNLWICNGSDWLDDNAAWIREICAGCGIVDQQVYDVNAGWINRYREPGIQSFDRFIAINRKIHEKFVRVFGMDPDRIDLIYSAINARRFHAARAAGFDRDSLRAAFGLPRGKRIFAFMGRLAHQKRPLDFLEIARLSAANEDQHFVLVGNGELAGEVEAWLAQHRPDNVTWIRNVADTTRFWPAVDACLVTSEYEGLPIALIEAISLGVPAVATDVGDIGHVLETWGAGRVVERWGDPEGFSEVLQGFVPELDEVSRALAARGGEIIDRFSAETIAGQFAESFARARAAREVS